MLCMALVSDPEILFLDEPTSGLDVASGHIIRDIVTRMNRERGMTVFLTTHHIDEAGDLCHRVAIIDQGRLAAIDTPQALRATVESRRSVEVRFADRAVAISDLLDPGAEVVPLADGFRVYAADPGRLAQEIATRATAKGDPDREPVHACAEPRGRVPAHHHPRADARTGARPCRRALTPWPGCAGRRTRPT
jgi:ABC-2 type transport system ATP-binding protein